MVNGVGNPSAARFAPYVVDLSPFSCQQLFPPSCRAGFAFVDFDDKKCFWSTYQEELQLIHD
jgi:hypothetical protein